MAGTLGLPVPPGFTITTDAWKTFASENAVVPEDMVKAVASRLLELGDRLGRAPDDVGRPLLLSVRSGAPVSMPGMMDTVLNVGLNDEVVRGLAARTTERFAQQSYLRLIATYAEVVREVPAAAIETLTVELEGVDDASRIERWKALIADHGAPFPQNTLDQVREAIEAVWRSWNRPRARRYRRFRGISEDTRYRGDGPGDGLRESRRRLGHRGGVHPRPQLWRIGPVRGLHVVRTGRRRGERHPKPRACRCAASPGGTVVAGPSGRHASARGGRQRHVRRGVHRAARRALGTAGPARTA